MDNNYCCLFVCFVFNFSNSASLASLTRETGPNLVKGDPARKTDTTPKFSHAAQHQFTPTLNISDSALKFTHILYNLSPAGNYLIFDGFIYIV